MRFENNVEDREFEGSKGPADSEEIFVISVREGRDFNSKKC